MEEPLEETLAVNIMMYVAPVLLLLGTVGNACTITVFIKRRNRNSSTYRYLCALAISDIVLLNTGLLRWWIVVLSGYDIRTTNDFVCKIHIFIVYFSMQCSSWLLVAVTCERLIGVYLPHRVKRGCTLKTSLAFVCGIVLVLALLNSHYLYGMSVITVPVDNETLVEICETAIESYRPFLNHTWHWIHFCMFCAIPLNVLLFGNTCIIIKLLLRRRKGRTHKLSVHASQTGKEDVQDKSTKITLLLVLLSTVFFVNTAPLAIFLAAQSFFFGEVTSDEEAAKIDLAYVIVNLFMYLNSAINFILYFLSGSRFRADVKALFLCGKLCPAKAETTSSTNQTNTETHDENMV